VSVVWLSILFAVVAVVAVVLWGVHATRNVDLAYGVNTGPVDFSEMHGFIQEKHERIGEYLKANWSGDPKLLTPLLDSLVAELEREAEQHQLPIDRHIAKNIVAKSVEAHRLAPGRAVRKAMARVA
jgi:hypothetical protein